MALKHHFLVLPTLVTFLVFLMPVMPTFCKIAMGEGTCGKCITDDDRKTACCKMLPADDGKNVSSPTMNSSTKSDHHQPAAQPALAPATGGNGSGYAYIYINCTDKGNRVFCAIVIAFYFLCVIALAVFMGCVSGILLVCLREMNI